MANFRGICWAVLMFGGDGWIWYVEILKYKGIIATAVPQEDTAQLEIVLGITNPLFSSNQRYGKKTCLMSLAFRFLYLKYDMLYHFRCVKLMTLFQENLQHTPHIPHPYIALKGLATHNRLLVFLKIAINFQFRCVWKQQPVGNSRGLPSAPTNGSPTSNTRMSALCSSHRRLLFFQIAERLVEKNENSTPRKKLYLYGWRT